MLLNKTILKILSVCVFCIISGCTTSPFGDDDFGGGSISAGSRSIQGKVNLNDGADPEGVFIWMEVFESSSYSDINGHYNLTLPNKMIHGGSTGISGFYKIFYYMANYLLDSAQVIVNENEFVYGKEDLTNDGILSPPRIMKQYVEIKKTIDPPTISTDYDSVITISVGFRATIDYAIIHFPEGDGLSTSIFIVNTDSNVVSVYEASLSSADSDIALEEKNGVEKGKPFSINMIFSLSGQPLSPGKYEYFPYFFTYHNKTHKDFLKKAMPGYLNLGLDFLKFPMKIEGGYFEVEK